MKNSFSLLLLAVYGLFSQQTMASVSFSSYPLVGYAKLPPNVLLLLSVEFPMGKGIYQIPYGNHFTDLDIRRNKF